MLNYIPSKRHKEIKSLAENKENIEIKIRQHFSAKYCVILGYMYVEKCLL